MTHRTALMWSPTFFPYFFSTSLRFMARGSNTMHKWFLWKKCLNSFSIGIQLNLFPDLRYWFDLYKKNLNEFENYEKNSLIFFKKCIKENFRTSARWIKHFHEKVPNCFTHNITWTVGYNGIYRRRPYH